MGTTLIPLYPFLLNIMSIIVINAPVWGIATALVDAIESCVYISLINCTYKRNSLCYKELQNLYVST
ncbi:hypothetical protein AGMMS49940_23440 [Spirochaetia bacterium]|nr:hypothetical protein AGMMS49940_23440 [Spirochaetia bacterium]